LRDQADAHGFKVIAPAGHEAPTLTVLAPPKHVMVSDLRERLDHKGVEVGATKDGIVVAHAGGASIDDLERFWRTVEALHLQN
jgi:aspartate aminotransferase-like enzyme